MERKNIDCEFTERDYHCIARILQSVIFAPEEGIFYGCQFCKFSKPCMDSHNIKHEDIGIDYLRVKLQKITGVDLDIFHNEDKFTRVATEDQRCGVTLRGDFGMKHIGTIQGLVYTQEKIVPCKLGLQIFNDSKGRTISLSDGEKQFTIPFDPIEKYLQKEDE